MIAGDLLRVRWKITIKSTLRDTVWCGAVRCDAIRCGDRSSYRCKTCAVLVLGLFHKGCVITHFSCSYPCDHILKSLDRQSTAIIRYFGSTTTRSTSSHKRVIFLHNRNETHNLRMITLKFNRYQKKDTLLEENF